VTPSANPIDGRWQTFVVTCSEVALVWISDACCTCVSSYSMCSSFCAVTPTLSPNPSPAPPGGKGGPTARCGNGFEVAEFTVSRQPSKWLSTTRGEWPALPATSIKFHSPHELVDFHHAATYGCWLPLSPGGAREGGGSEWGKTPENRCAASTTAPLCYSGPHWPPSPQTKLKPKHSLTCVTRQIPPPRHRRCQVMPSAKPIDGKWQTFVVTCSEVALVWISDACCTCVSSYSMCSNFCAVTPTLSPTLSRPAGRERELNSQMWQWV
jgi:hypothetical protein